MWFEVNQYTSRIHFHLDEVHGHHMGFNLPLEALISKDVQFIVAFKKQFINQSITYLPNYKITYFSKKITNFTVKNDKIEFKSEFGLVSCNYNENIDIDRIMEEARSFAMEWYELRAVFKNKLYNKVL